MRQELVNDFIVLALACHLSRLAGLLSWTASLGKFISRKFHSKPEYDSQSIYS